MKPVLFFIVAALTLVSARAQLRTNLDSISYAYGVLRADRIEDTKLRLDFRSFNMGITDDLTGKPLLMTEDQMQAMVKNLQTAHTSATLDSASYAFGVNTAEDLKTYGISQVSFMMLNTGITTARMGRPMFNRTQCRKILYAIPRPEFYPNLRASEKFLAENRTKPGVITLPDGLQYMVLQQGSGPKVKLTDTVTAHYKGTLITGEQFDSSYDRHEPLVLNDITLVIPGWTEALQLMNTGAKYRLFIPPSLGYGSRQRSKVIVPYSALIFDVEVVKIGK